MKFLYFIFFIFISCNSNFNLNETWNQALEFRKESNLKEAITSLKKIIKFGKDDLFLVKAQYQLADIYLNDVNNYTFATQEFKKLIDKYPESEFAKKSIFMLGYINSNYIQSYDDAITYYSMFLKKYPNDDLVYSVKYELDLLDSLGVINIIENFRSKNK